MASEIRVNKIENRSGLGTVTFADTGVDLAGITTAATLRATTGIVTNFTANAVNIGIDTGVYGEDLVVTGNSRVTGITTFGDSDNPALMFNIDATSGLPSISIPDSIIHSGDTNTKIRFPAADTVTTETGGSERLRIDSSGRLLVGHSTGNGYPQLSISGNTAGASGAGMIFLRRGLDRATIGSNVGADLGEIKIGDLDGNVYASIQGKTDAATGSSDYPGRLIFATTADSGSSPTERMRLDSAGNLKFNSGYGSVGTAYGVRAWADIYWNSGTPTARANGNVNSISDNGTGDMTISFTNSMPDTDYSCLVSGDDYGNSQYPGFNVGSTSRGKTTGGVTVNATQKDGTARDIAALNFAVIR